MFLAALEATAVATAMPTAVADLGGMERFSWVFSAYLLTSTTTVPLFGKLADLYGRLRIYIICMVLFLLGSAASGLAPSFEWLIFARALQGIGAGGVMPVSVTLIGDIFTLEERGRMQGLFSGVWGVSSLVGPAIGGFVTDAFSWRYVFFFAIPFGTISALMLKVYFREPQARKQHKLDLLGTALLTASIALLLVAILEGSEAWGWDNPLPYLMLAGAVFSFFAFLRQERRAPEPIVPLDIFENRIIAVSCAGSVVIGTLLFTLTAFVPMFAQGVLGGNAAQSGAPLIALSLGWPVASTIAGRLMIRVGYRTLVLPGSAIAFLGALLFSFAGPDTTMLYVMACMVLIGIGMGLLSTPYLVALQNAVAWSRRGIVTSVGQFSRTIGGAVAVAGFGAILNARLHARIGEGMNANAILDPAIRDSLTPEATAALRDGLASGLHAVFLACAILAFTGVLIALLFPAGSAQEHAHPAERAA